MKTIETDSFLADIGLDNLTKKERALTYLKIVFVVPFKFLMMLIRYLFNPKKSILRVFKKTIVLPFLEFFTGKKTTDKILDDYSVVHNAIVRKETFDENLKMNFGVHQDILINSKLSSLIMMFLVLLVYEEVLEGVDAINSIVLGSAILAGAFAHTSFGAFLLASISFFFLSVKAMLVIASFSVEFALVKSLFITKREEIQDYIDSATFYADLKNREVFGNEHADKVKQAMYEAYLTNKEEFTLIDRSVVNKIVYHEVKEIENKRGVEK